MTTEDRAVTHRATLVRLAAEGGPLTAHSRNATTQNPEWFNVRHGEPLQDRRRLHKEILARFIESRPHVRQDLKAIVLAGPPGTDKFTVHAALFNETRTQHEHWLPINTDDFKDELLRQAVQDGSYDRYLVPDEVRGLEAAGEKFYPREMAALVHTESSILAGKVCNEALRTGMNVIIDGTLGNEKQARILLERLNDAGYDVLVADVESTQGVSQACTVGRWERKYLEAENGTAAGIDAELGGCWVPQTFPASLFNDPKDEQSVCEANAAAVVIDYGCITGYQVYRLADKDAEPKLQTSKGRHKPGGPLFNSDTLAVILAASTTHWPVPRDRAQAGKESER